MLSYDPAIIRHIPTLEVANKSVKENGAFHEFLADFEALVNGAGLQDSLGITLVHRHATVPSSSRLMDFKQTLQPFPLAADAKDLYGHPIKWKSVTLHGERWMPYEYELGDEPGENPEFLLAVKGLLKRHGVKNIGLRRFSPQEPEELEITEKLGISVKIPWIKVNYLSLQRPPTGIG